MHHAYLAEVGFPRGTGMRSAVYQATCSPFRNPLDDRERASIRFACSRAGHARRASCWRARRASAIRRCAGASTQENPFFDNQVAFLEIDGRRNRMWLQKTVPGENDGYSLETVFERVLAD